MINELNSVKEILNDNLYMTLSTCDKAGNPWISNLYFVYDNSFNFYWYSPKNSKHSKLICKNPNVALCIFNSTSVGNNVRALYFQAKAYEVKDLKEISRSLILYGRKMLKTKFVNGKEAYVKFVDSIKDFKSNSPIRMYKAVPKKTWKLASSKIYNDKYVDGRTEIKI